MPLAAPQVTKAGACGGDPDAFGTYGPDKRRLDPGCPASGCTHDGSDPREHGVRLLDAFVEVCRRAQAATDVNALPRTHGTTARITVTTSWEALRDQLETPTGSGLLGSGQSLSAQAVRRLACDAEILPAVLGTQGQILDIGRSQRLVTTVLWLALVLRDQHCTFPGCTRMPQACEAHHIVHWADGGATSLDNLALLCRRHHTLTHQSPWRIHLDPVTRRPVWRPPPSVDDRAWWSYHPATSPPLRSAVSA